ncbi:AbgT family transporter [uncultured Veillonella sp.]|uniref:AbgT family transporter n=1 Tax=uncultured Veillonella sp. TaxID=159268 RepID=UPI00261DCA90|nr:AbgT family transporter [uncultured Veillonella sp.]
MGESNVKKKKTIMELFLSGVESVGNKLPDPVSLFIILAILTIVVSAIMANMGVEVVHPGTHKTIKVVNLLSVDGFREIWGKAVNNFSTFAPLAMVLVAVIGAGIAEKSGFLSAFMQKMLGDASKAMVTFVIIFIGINGNVAGDAAFVVLPPVAGAIFLGMGRNPLLGVFTAFASVAAGFCANMMLGMSDSLAYGFTEAAAHIVDPNYTGSPAINYYFLLVSCILLSITGTVVTEKIMAPRFSNDNLDRYELDHESFELTEKKSRAVTISLWALLATLVVIVLLCIGDNPILGDPKTGSIMDGKSPFMQGIILLVTIILFVPGCVFGFASGKYKNDKDMFADISLAFKDISSYILLCFFCAQFTSYFNWSNIGAVLAIKGAETLQAWNFTGIPLIIGLIIVSCIVNIFIGSASAKWAILAPVMVPMMMMLGYDPALTQVAYRIGDSITNPLSPLFYYFPLVLGFVRKYEKDAGMGTIIANMIPYSFSFAIVWIIMIAVWVFFDWPLGPGGNIYL